MKTDKEVNEAFHKHMTEFHKYKYNQYKRRNEGGGGKTYSIIIGVVTAALIGGLVALGSVFFFHHLGYHVLNAIFVGGMLAAITGILLSSNLYTEGVKNDTSKHER